MRWVRVLKVSHNPAHDAGRAGGRLGRTELRLCRRLGGSAKAAQDEGGKR